MEKRTQWQPTHSMAPLALAMLGAALCWVTPNPAWTETFKCREPDGHIGYQETPCPVDSEGSVLSSSSAPPTGPNATHTSKAYTVEGQLKALESQKRQARKAREKSSPESSHTQVKPKAHDAARCAKHRAEAARWRREVRRGYRDKDERDRRAEMLKHHEALVERYCPPGR